MRNLRAIVTAGITIGTLGGGFVTAGAAWAALPTPVNGQITDTPPPPPTPTSVNGVITGVHTFTLATGQTVELRETLHPNVPGYNVNVPVTGISVNHNTSVTTVTTGYTFLPLNRIGQATTFTVVLLP
jgi:hypothetical protein